MRITFLPHARQQMRALEVSEGQVRAVLENPTSEYPSYKRRLVAEKAFPGERLAIKVVYNKGLRDERVIVTVTRGRPRKNREG